MSEEIRSLLQGTVALDALPLTALYLTLTRGSVPLDPGDRRRLIGLAAGGYFPGL
jgi:hypothetical protein